MKRFISLLGLLVLLASSSRGDTLEHQLPGVLEFIQKADTVVASLVHANHKAEVRGRREIAGEEKAQALAIFGDAKSYESGLYDIVEAQPECRLELTKGNERLVLFCGRSLVHVTWNEKQAEAPLTKEAQAALEQWLTQYFRPK